MPSSSWTAHAQAAGAVFGSGFRWRRVRRSSTGVRAAGRRATVIPYRDRSASKYSRTAAPNRSAKAASPPMQSCSLGSFDRPPRALRRRQGICRASHHAWILWAVDAAMPPGEAVGNANRIPNHRFRTPSVSVISASSSPSDLTRVGLRAGPNEA